MQNESLPTQMGSAATKNDALWQLAKKRTAFKISATSYVIINCFLVILWFFTSGPKSYFWPIWPIIGWGLGIAMTYVNTYHDARFFSAEKEYEKLKNQTL